MYRYTYARPLAQYILIMRDLHKQISFLKTEIDPDGRMRTTYNIAGTNTGRLASSMSEFGTGTNLQNVNRKLRYPFTADPGMYMVNIDLEQADGRNVGAICWNAFHATLGPEVAGAYLDACESGDLHTTVCRMTWPELDWPDDPTEWKKFCDGLIAHGQDSYRQLAKKLGHGTNYYGTPRTMAKHAHVPTKVIEDFQERYFEKFPVIKAWHEWTIEQVKETGTLTTPFGRRRMFFGRGNDAATHRKAIAYSPQSMTGEQIDRGLLQIWRKFPQVQLLNQVHDSILLQLPRKSAETLIPEILKTMLAPLNLVAGRDFTIPLDAAGGWNWGYADKINLYGLTKWTGRETRELPTPKQRLRDYL
jgi:DNA polymerase I